MTIKFDRLLAAIRITLVCGVFWGLAAAIGRAGYTLIVHGWQPTLMLTAAGRMFVVGGTLGLFGGALYTGALALLGGRREGAELSTLRAATIGAAVGVAVAIAIKVVALAGISSIPVIVIMSSTLAALGGATGVALVGTARKAALPKDTASNNALRE